jgi:replicative DNA helicase
MISDPFLNKVPPQNIDAEESILSAMMLDNGCLEDVFSIIKSEDFYKNSHKSIFSAMFDLFSKNKPIDLVTIAESLGKSEKLEEIGGATFLAQIVDTVPMAANVIQYSNIVKEKSILRSLIVKSNNITEMCFNDNRKTLDIVDYAASEINNISESTFDSDTIKSGSELSNSVLDRLEKISKIEGVSGVPTGLFKIDDATSGLQPANLIILAARPSMGKELSENSPVFMEDGTEKKIKNIKIGDRVASVDIKSSAVSGVFPQGVKPIYKVEFSDGRIVEAGLNHQWSVKYRDWEEYRVLTTKELINKLNKKRYKKRLYIPRHKGFFGKDKNILVDPYLLGVLIGDGSLIKTVKLSTSHSFILNKIKPMLQGCDIRNDNGVDYRLCTDRGKENKLLTNLKSLKLIGKRSYEKFIPSQYLSASKKTRNKLLQGLIDTDGTIEKLGGMSYSTSSLELKNNVIKLARSLGAFVRYSSRIPTYKYKGEKKKGRRSYNIYISCPNYGEFVTIPFKKNRVVKKQRLKRSTFKTIEFIGYKQAYCISVDHPKRLYLTNDYVVTHNTAMALTIARNAAEMGKSVFIKSYETKAEMLAQRVICGISGINSEKLRDPKKLDDREWKILNSASDQYSRLKIKIDDNFKDQVSNIRRKALKIKKEDGLDLIIIDHLTRMPLPKADRHDLAIGKVTSDLSHLSSDLNVPVLLLSQLNRELEKRDNKRPRLSDLKNSGNIEEDGDIVAFLYRDFVYNEGEKDCLEYDEFILAKDRDGRLGTIKIKFLPETTRFVDYNGY